MPRGNNKTNKTAEFYRAVSRLGSIIKYKVVQI